MTEVTYKSQSMMFRIVWADKNSKEEKLWQVNRQLKDIGCTVFRVERLHEPEECCEKEFSDKKVSKEDNLDK